MEACVASGLGFVKHLVILPMAEFFKYKPPPKTFEADNFFTRQYSWIHAQWPVVVIVKGSQNILNWGYQNNVHDEK